MGLYGFMFILTKGLPVSHLPALQLLWGSYDLELSKHII